MLFFIAHKYQKILLSPKVVKCRWRGQRVSKLHFYDRWKKSIIVSQIQREKKKDVITLNFDWIFSCLCLKSRFVEDILSKLTHSAADLKRILPAKRLNKGRQRASKWNLPMALKNFELKRFLARQKKEKWGWTDVYDPEFS